MPTSSRETTEPANPRDSDAHSLLLVVSAKLASVAVLFLIGVLVARSTGPLAYGHYATALGLLLLIDAMVGGPLDIATVRFSMLHRDEPRRVARLQSAIFRLKLLFGVLLLAFSLPVAAPVGRLLFDSAEETPLLLATLLGAAILLLLRGTAAWLQVEGRFRAYSTLDLALAGLRLAGALLLYGSATSAWPWLGLYGLTALGVFLAALIVMPPPWLRAPWPHRGDMGRIGGYLGITTAIVALGTFTGRSDIIFLSMLGNAEEVGQYGVALQMAMAGTLLAGYASILTQPKVVPFTQQGRLSELLQLNLLVAGAIALFLIPFTLWAIPSLILLIFGENYAPATPLLQILIIGTFLDLLIMPVLMPYALQLHPRYTLIAEAGVTTIYLAGLVVINQWGAIGIAWLVTGIRGLKLLAYLGILLRTLPKDVGKWDF